MLNRVVVGVAVILVGAAMLAPSKVLALKKKDIISKVYCLCLCTMSTEDGIKMSDKTFLAPEGDPKRCSSFDTTGCKTKIDGEDQYGELSLCNSLVERGGPKRVSPGAQPLAPVAPSIGGGRGNDNIVDQPGKLAPQDNTGSPTFQRIAPKSGVIAPDN